MSPARVTELNVHATGLVLGGVGLVLRGPSGAGKSLLALEALELWAAIGETAFLVSDDRVEFFRDGKGISMRSPKSIGGLIELRGRGIVHRPHLATASLHLVVDLVDDLIRMVEEDQLRTELLGVSLARCPVPRRGTVDSSHQLLLIREAIRELNPATGALRQKTT